jgi:hypothetical protein
MGKGREHALVGVLFVVLAIVMTWPLAQHLGSLAKDQGDPLLNAWIMSWDVHWITTHSSGGFFDANIFFPYHGTLNYSEHLIPQALVGLAPLLLTGNPLFAYNLVWILAMAGSAFAMYLLARRLTGSTAAAVFAGIAYGFSLFMMSQLPHLQVLCAAGLPLSFYFLHRFRAGERVRDVVYLGVTVAVQMLANGYFAVILPMFLGVALVHYAIAAQRLRDRHFLARMALLAVVIAVIAGPFLYQYAAFQAEMGFSRGVGDDATLTSYLSAPWINRLWGHLTARFWRNERMYFPGLVTLAFAVIGVGVRWRRLVATVPERPASAKPGRAIPLSWLFNAVASLLGLAILVVLGFGYFRARFEVKAHDINNPLLFLLVLLLLRLAVDRPYRDRMRSIFAQHREPLLVYGEMLTLAFLLSVGKLGPFIILNRYVPGFDAIRAFPRIHVFFTLALAVFAAFGFAWLQAKVAAARRRVLVVGACGLLLAELACVPLRLERVRPLPERSPVYAWLAGQAGDDWGVAELPFATGTEALAREIQRVYASTRHWKRTMSGYSGYFPPMWHELCERWNPAPLTEDLEELRGVGLRFVVLHLGEMSAAQRGRAEAALGEVQPGTHLVAELGQDRVYELPGWSRWPSPPTQGEQLDAVDRSDIQASASVDDTEARLAIDGKLATRWHTGPQRAGDYFQLDFGAIRRVRGVSLMLGEFSRDYPRGYRVEASLDGEHWSRLAQRERADLPLHAFLRPKRLSLDIWFPPTPCRYLRVTNLGSDPSIYWSIAEITAWQ